MRSEIIQRTHRIQLLHLGDERKRSAISDFGQRSGKTACALKMLTRLESSTVGLDQATGLVQGAVQQHEEIDTHLFHGILLTQMQLGRIQCFVEQYVGNSIAAQLGQVLGNVGQVGSAKSIFNLRPELRMQSLLELLRGALYRSFCALANIPRRCSPKYASHRCLALRRDTGSLQLYVLLDERILRIDLATGHEQVLIFI
mmetsp:Transcript_4797/g.11970  ORF Transcript_4797/g.11970 Transcript_4797/m.11970 type:complete len:200 (-) Transcript_4797:1822-2421(-)